MTGMTGISSRTVGRAALFASAVAVALTIGLAPGRLLEGAPQQPNWKGIWEPMNYKGDIYFEDVFFVTADKGWVAGVGSPSKGGGVILHTKDGGKTWSTQFGDPESSDKTIRYLFFLDERRGWAIQGTTLLHTSDGETWEAAGTVSGYSGEYRFVSPTVGIMGDGEEIKRTEDGGKSWATTGKCAATVVIAGLTKRETCKARSVHFPSRRVGYAVGDGYEKAFYLMKTTDGGRSWTTTGFPAESGGYEVFFTDERRGFVRTYSRTIYGTEDGGVSWKRLTGLLINDFKFADPVVGWSMKYREMNYSTNGGRSWLTREIPFPTMVTAFSIPRRDRGYAVGEHGMIYRYSVVKVTQPTGAGALPAPLMPTFETLLDEKVEELDDFVESLEESIAKMPDDAGGNSSNAGSSASAGGNSESGGTSSSESFGSTEAASGSDEILFSESTDLPTLGSGSTDSNTSGSGSTDAATSSPGFSGGTSGSEKSAPASPFIEKCCGKSVSRWYLAMQAAESILPQFVAQFKNTNLLGAGLRMLVVLPARVNATSAAFSSFKRSKNKDDAKANVTQLQAAVDALKQGVSSALQKPVPST